MQLIFSHELSVDKTSDDLLYNISSTRLPPVRARYISDIKRREKENATRGMYAN